MDNENQPSLFETAEVERQATDAKNTAVACPKPKLEPSWLEKVGDEFNKPYMKDLKQFLVKQKRSYTIYPKGKNVFNSFWLTPFYDVRVVILGQDPYHGPNQAHGLCFSVNRSITAPPSLINIFKELNNDLGCPIPGHGDLTSWAEQGVFLLNTVLTVQANRANSHAGKGWEYFTDTVISILSRERKNLVFMLWGRHAQNKMGLIDASRHLILNSPHPSPFSAHQGFFGCKHFSKANNHLITINTPPIHWALPT